MDMATRPLNRPDAPWCWRLVATALSFALFGLGGLCLRLVVFPLLGLVPGDARARRRRARAVVSWTLRRVVRFLYRTRVLTYEVEGAERLGRPGQMIVANHPSLIDVVVMIALIRDTVLRLRDTGLATVLVEQRVDTVLRMADRVAFMAHGRVEADVAREGMTAESTLFRQFVGV